MAAPMARVGKRCAASQLAGMLRSTRGHISLVIGVVMVGLGAWLLVNAFVLRRPPVSGKPLLDAAFAFFFMLRGAMNVRAGRRIAAATGTMSRGGPPPS